MGRPLVPYPARNAVDGDKVPISGSPITCTGGDLIPTNVWWMVEFSAQVMIAGVTVYTHWLETLPGETIPWPGNLMSCAGLKNIQCNKAQSGLWEVSTFSCSRTIVGQLRQNAKAPAQNDPQNHWTKKAWQHFNDQDISLNCLTPETIIGWLFFVAHI